MKCAGCIATEIHQCYRKSCTCMECNPCSLTVGTNEMLARIEALEGALEKIRDGHSEVFPMQQANDFELRGFAARALLPAPRKESEPVMYCTSPGHRTFNGGCWDCGRPKAAPLADGGKEGK